MAQAPQHALALAVPTLFERRFWLALPELTGKREGSARARNSLRSLRALLPLGGHGRVIEAPEFPDFAIRK